MTSNKLYPRIYHVMHHQLHNVHLLCPLDQSNSLQQWYVIIYLGAFLSWLICLFLVRKFNSCNWKSAHIPSVRTCLLYYLYCLQPTLVDGPSYTILLTSMLQEFQAKRPRTSSPGGGGGGGDVQMKERDKNESKEKNS